MDDLIKQRRDFLRDDPTYQARVERVLCDAENGILPPLLDWERLQEKFTSGNVIPEGEAPPRTEN